jgi:asparagine synthase (glutamine-hydrolysing)
MPGLSIVYRAAGGALPPGDRWEAALAAARGDAPSRRLTHFADDRCRIGSDAAAHHPIETREDARVFVAFEGRVYGGPARAPMDELMSLAGTLAGGGEPAAAIRSRIAGWEGEYVAVVYAKAERRLWLFSDPLARLPLYAAPGARGLAVSRDQRFVLAHEGMTAVDPMGIAQLLLFGFPLGRHTLIRGVAHVPAGQGLRAAPDGIDTIEGLGEPLDFGRKDRAGISADRNAAELAELFTDACRVRAEAGDPPILALSGGLDSRAVGAGLVCAGRTFDSCTVVDDAGVYAHEAPVARDLARALGSPWRRFQAPAARGEGLQRMLEMKTGLNSLAMAFSLPVFGMLREAYGAARTYWSGDGGDKVLPDHRPRLPRGADVVDYLVASRPIWPAAMIARLTGVSEEALRAGVEEEVARYPERDADQRFVRFQFVERGARWIFEGEDCNRHHFWTVAPFYDRAFLRAALACPDGQKSGHRLYRRFLQHLHPAINRIPDANLGIAMASPAYAWARRLREIGRRFPGLRRRLRLGQPSSVLQPRPALMGRFLERQLERSDAVRACFSVATMAEVASAPAGWSDAALDALVTATCACERIAGGGSTLAEFADESFG